MSLQLDVFGSMGSAGWDLERPDEFQACLPGDPSTFGYRRVLVNPAHPGAAELLIGGTDGTSIGWLGPECAMWAEFLAAIAEGRSAHADFEDGVRANAVNRRDLCGGAQRGADGGRRSCRSRSCPPASDGVTVAEPAQPGLTATLDWPVPTAESAKLNARASIVSDKNHPVQWAYRAWLLECGIYVHPHYMIRGFLTGAHTEADIDRVVYATAEFLSSHREMLAAP